MIPSFAAMQAALILLRPSLIARTETATFLAALFNKALRRKNRPGKIRPVELHGF
jgi:hypothetical protein